MNWQPTFIGIGAQKSATTWCAEALRLHPQICIAQPKELNYFHENFARGEAWYAQHFARPELPIQGEISPLYMDHPRVARLIADCYPDARILAVLRNPFDRAVSNLLHEVRFTDGQVAGASRDRIREFARADEKFLRRSCYAEALQPFFTCFSASRIAVLFYDDLQADPKAFLKQVYKAVAAAPDFVPTHELPAINRTDDYVFPRLYRGLRRVSQLAKSWGPTRSGMEWLYRNSRLRERVLFHMTADRGRPQMDFVDIFGDGAVWKIREDMDRLRGEFGVAIPSTWVQATQGHALTRSAA